MNIRLTRLLAPAAVLFSAACVELDVTNPNNPDIPRALASPSDVARIATSSINAWWLAATHYEPSMMLQVTADHSTANFGNFGMRFNNEQPRIPYANSSASGDELAARRSWTLQYSALGGANDAISAMNNGIVIPGGVDENERTRSAALFVQAAAHMTLGLQYDRAFVVTAPPAPPNLPTLRPYAEVLDTAMVLWDDLIALTNGKTWGWEAEWFPWHDAPDGATASDINRLANTMAARTLVYGARNLAETNAVDWNAVLAYADNGLTGTGFTDMDFGITDDYNIWWDYIKNYGNWHAWTRVDQRVINRMDPDIPAQFTGVGNQPVSTPNDNRLGVRTGTCGNDIASCIAGLTTDYVDLRTVIGDPGRGIWMQSTFYHLRYRNSSFAVPAAVNIGLENPHILAAENDLLIAEAETRRAGGDLTRAANLVNKTRVTRGGLAPVAAAVPDLLAAIEYERDVELLNTGAISLYDRRRINGLQAGTFRHMPIPARELEVLGLPVYTFGGVGLPDM